MTWKWKMAWFDLFGTGKHYIPDFSYHPIPADPEAVMSKSVEAQGVFDFLGLFDDETVEKIKNIVKAIDPTKIDALMKMIEPKEDGSLTINIDFRIRRND